MMQPEEETSCPPGGMYYQIPRMIPSLGLWWVYLGGFYG